MPSRSPALSEVGLSDARREELRRVSALEKRDVGYEGGADLGRPLAVERGQIEISRGEFLRHEPDNKFSTGVIGTRAQRVWAPDRMLRGENSPIEQYHHDAATRYYDDFLIGEMGARKNQARGGARLDPWARLPYSEARAQRRQSYRQAREAVGARFLGVLVWCVLQETPADRADLAPTVQAWATSVGWGTERAVGWLAGALEALARHYGYTRGNSPSTRRVASQT